MVVSSNDKMLNTFRARSSCEQDAKFVQDRIVSTERTLAEICYIFGQYCRKTASLRDKGDELCKILLTYAGTEDINRSLSLGVENFADCLATLNAYGDMRVLNLETKVVKEFGRYEDICKRVKDDVKQIYNAREKEMARKRQLDRIRQRNPRNRQQIIQAETELVKATSEVSKTIHNLDEKTNEFERQKLHDIKFILLDFVSIEMGYHARALEVLTSAFKSISSIDEDTDLQDFQTARNKMETEFQKNLRFTDRRGSNKSNLSRTAHSLGSLGAIFTAQKSPGIPKGPSKSAETLDSMKYSISDTEESIATANDENSDNDTDGSKDDKSSPDPQVRQVFSRKQSKK